MQNKRTKSRRGVALLLVMIALIVGTILTAGFLNTQSTSNGIARNERDQARCRAYAESGIALTVNFIKSNPHWRTTLNPGTWLTAQPVGAGTVTVTAASADGSTSFTTDNTQPLLLTSVGACNNRTFSVSAVVTPTGGGTPWYAGTFTSGTILLRDTAYVDSYNSTQSAYSPNTAVSLTNLPKYGNATLWNNAATPGALTIKNSSVLLGSFIAAANSDPLADLSILGSAQFIGSASDAPEPRTPGSVIGINLANFPGGSLGNYAPTSSTTLNTNLVTYNNFNLTSAAGKPVISINQNALFHITGNFTLSQKNTLKIGPNCSVIFVVDGNVTCTNSAILTIGGNSQLTIYCSGTISADKTSSLNASNNPSALTILGLKTCSSIQTTDSALLCASIFAPQADITFALNSIFAGSAVAHSLTVRDNAALHMDDAVRNQTLHNVTGGSAQGDYIVTYQQ